MEEHRLKFGISLEEIGDGRWSIGMCLSHEGKETYLYVNLLKLSFSIGRMYLPV